jgi:hypothetical protein
VDRCIIKGRAGQRENAYPAPNHSCTFSGKARQMAAAKSTTRHTGPLIDLTGRLYGPWEIVGFHHKQGDDNHWRVKCKCGIEMLHTTQECLYYSGGCPMCRWSSDTLLTKYFPKEKQVWRAMHFRCKDTTDSNYGGRGIKVCERWSEADGFTNFMMDMGKRPSDDLQIDRIDVNGNYEKSNARWVTNKVNQRNKRSALMLTLGGITQCATEWEEDLGILHKRVGIRKWFGWSDEEAISRPVRKYTMTHEMFVEIMDEVSRTGASVMSVAKSHGVTPSAVYHRKYRAQKKAARQSVEAS